VLVSVAVTALLASGCASNPRSILKQSYQAMSDLKGIEWQVETSSYVRNQLVTGSFRFIQLAGGPGATARWKIEGAQAGVPFEMFYVDGKRYTYTQGRWFVDSRQVPSTNPLGFIDEAQLDNALDVRLVGEDEQSYTISYTFDNSQSDLMSMVPFQSQQSAQPDLSSDYSVTISKKTDWITRQEMTVMLSRENLVQDRQDSVMKVVTIDPPVTIDLPAQAYSATPTDVPR
jgi:hypothetical protein